MDLKSFTRRRLQLSASDQHTSSSSRVQVMKRFGSNTFTLTKILALPLLALPILFLLSIMLRHSPSPDNVISQVISPGSDSLLGGLLASGFDEAACTSRYQSYLYRNTSLHKPSPYLISRLRSYEDLHKRCGPDTEFYSKALEQLQSGQEVVGSADCQYIVWICFSGLGNRILSLASTFLYALLTNRVLLVDRGKDMADLFCEPFPEKSWLLPLDFPLADQFGSFDQKSSRCYGNMLKNNVVNASAITYLYLHLVHDYDDHDKLFFCDEDQSLFTKVKWLVVRTDNYFVPSLFLINSFEQELSMLFPRKGTVFHHIGRYIFHPSNQVWGLITRYYQTYLAKADESIGIQIRVFDERPGPFKHVMDQILACTLKEKLLPEVDLQDSSIGVAANPKLKTVLVTSLNAGYSENLKNMYWEHSTATGEVVGVYQPSHEEYQQTGKLMHNRKAWAEMYLLSLTDKLVTSSWSTFGYVAQGLGGLKPWILYKPENETTPDPPCRRAMSMDPCFHAPPFYDCKAKRGTDTGALVPHVRHCEDMSWGLKVVDGEDEL
ncbi:galactoside 2-alpha-L-fucosyltransferase-like isoform X1 [Mercurialis annua]|uniref:galactoside 2-alpha-L-fucosyltransferase-like isoform X1 n=1 Tax=Mercurialis annua TaxID=3986 RepID=UPI00215ECE37|nr:galactoside 2-alpha-L-fucosyltransferase-like isoform X1 [Mercurialis annua]